MVTYYSEHDFFHFQAHYSGFYGPSGLLLENTSPFMTVESESLLYPLTSLVAEFGGTLGLFLGFSFMWLWDGVELLAPILAKIQGSIRVIKPMKNAGTHGRLTK